MMTHCVPPLRNASPVLDALEKATDGWGKPETQYEHGHPSRSFPFEFHIILTLLVGPQVLAPLLVVG